jgi:hypothetical protein
MMSNATDIIPDENWFEWVTEGLLILVLGLLGLLGNCISIYTFSKQCVHRIFHNLLLALAMFDIVSITKHRQLFY